MSDATGVSERGLMARVRAGDDLALALIYDEHSPLVFGIGKRLVGAAAAGDVTQQVFLTLWERPDGFDESKGSLRTFLAVLARRRSIDMLRGRTRGEQREQRVAHRRVREPEAVDEVALTSIASDRVRRAVAQLPPDQRRAIELAYFEGLTFREVALATGVAEGTAKSRLRLGLARLADELSDIATVEVS